MSTMWWRLNEKLCGEESSIKLVLVKYSFPSSIPLRSAVYMGKSDMYTSECVCVFVCVRLTLRVVGICHCPWELGGWEGLGWMHVFLETRLREILWQGNNLCSFKEDLRRGKKKKKNLVVEALEYWFPQGDHYSVSGYWPLRDRMVCFTVNWEQNLGFVSMRTAFKEQLVHCLKVIATSLLPLNLLCHQQNDLFQDSNLIILIC